MLTAPTVNPAECIVEVRDVLGLLSLFGRPMLHPEPACRTWSVDLGGSLGADPAAADIFVVRAASVPPALQTSVVPRLVDPLPFRASRVVAADSHRWNAVDECP